MTARSIRRAMERKAKKLEKKHLQTEMLPEARLPPTRPTPNSLPARMPKSVKRRPRVHRAICSPLCTVQ
jgi:hypothetical protein